jgi:hypothetical protein
MDFFSEMNSNHLLLLARIGPVDGCNLLLIITNGIYSLDIIAGLSNTKNE